MKSLSLMILTSLFLCLFTSSQNSYKIPPGTVLIAENLFMDRTEIRNIDWREFVSWNLKTYGQNSEEYLTSLPDTLVWRDSDHSNEPFINYYFQHVAYQSYPVVGITYEQVIRYCQWRSDRVNENLAEKDKNNHPENKYNYRLPTRQEWEMVAALGYTKRIQRKVNKLEKSSNFSSSAGDQPSGKNSDITAPVKSYFPNQAGIYNLYGNVAEMIYEKGIAKGGSWKDEAETVTIEKDFIYNQPTDWLGFRCVCEVK